MMKLSRFFLAGLICFFFLTTGLQAQARLSFQGILKKSNGIAVDDGTYSITFSLYNVEQGGSALWSETQSDVEVSSGIYSVLLGATKPLDVAFNEEYYLGVKVGSTGEMQPRFRLTSAPYALSLIGDTNKFPSSGAVNADEVIVAGKLAVGAGAVSPSHTLQVIGGVLTRVGAPGANNGYSFEGDTDSGLFSTAEGAVSLFSNNTERLKVHGAGVEVNGDQTVNGKQVVSGTLDVGTTGTPGDVKLSKGGAIVYNGVRDWQLVDVDDFEEGQDGWSSPNPILRSQLTTYNIPNAFGQGSAIAPNVANGRLEKEFDLSGIPHTKVKVEFTMISWGWDVWDFSSDFLFAGFNVGNESFVQWHFSPFGDPRSVRGEMVVDKFTGDRIKVFFTSIVNENGERFAVDNVEVYVR